MKPSKEFKEQIKAYLDKRAEEDELFAVTYKKENKNLDECCNYIINCAKNNGASGYSDEEVFGWAVHYYDEDDIKNVSAPSGKVVINRSVELTEEEKQQAREKAIADLAEEEKKTLKLDYKVELTEEDKAEIKQKAIDSAVEEAKNTMLRKKKKTSTPAPAVVDNGDKSIEKSENQEATPLTLF